MTSRSPFSIKANFSVLILIKAPKKYEEMCKPQYLIYRPNHAEDTWYEIKPKLQVWGRFFLNLFQKHLRHFYFDLSTVLGIV